MKKTIFLCFLIVIVVLCVASEVSHASIIIDSYSEFNQDGNLDIDGNLTFGVSQGFIGNDRTLDIAKWNLQKVSNPTGYAYAKLYATTGTWGVDLMPIGDPLATSDPVDISTLSADRYQLISFHFSTPYTPLTGTHYCLSFEYTPVVGNYVLVGNDVTSPTAPGNSGMMIGVRIIYPGPKTMMWSTYSNEFIFYAISDDQTDITPPSAPTGVTVN
jgi:hypothetical protein